MERMDWMISWNYSLTIYKSALVGFLDGSDGRESACSTGDLSLIPGLGRSRRSSQEIPQPRRRKQQPTPVFLPGESHGQRSLAGYSPWGCRVRHYWATNSFTCGTVDMFLRVAKINLKKNQIQFSHWLALEFQRCFNFHFWLIFS